MLVLIDNYDSFVHNLARYFRLLGQQTHVVRCDRIDVAGVAALNPSAIVLSPGPCTPDEAGCCLDVVSRLSQSVPMLGVCLGHQVIAQAFGGTIIREQPAHGIAGMIDHDGSALFAGLPNPFPAARYHSLVACADSMPDCLASTAWTASEGNESERIVMGIAHRQRPVYGVQFHPESVLTDHGSPLLRNFLMLAGIVPGAAS